MARLLLISAIDIYIIVALCIALCSTSITAHAMVNPTPQQPQPTTTTTSRRSLLTRMPLVVIGATTSLSITTLPSSTTVARQIKNTCEEMNCQCTNCQYNKRQSSSCSSFLRNNNNFVVNAYERRDVGDETSSGETKAMNDQAYETNNRLERDGLVLEVR